MHRLWLILILALGAHAQDDFARAIEPRAFAFPADHGAHPDYKTEWWYFTGVVQTPDGERIGYQATWFRTGLTRRPVARRSRLAARDVFFFHGALSDLGRDRFAYEHRACRGAPAWAGARTDAMDVHLFDTAVRPDPNGGWRLAFRVKDREVRLHLTPTLAPLLHGRRPGLSTKGAAAGQASYYYSFTRLRTKGTIQRTVDGPAVPVTGRSWFDHEFGSSQLDRGQVGWDWFSVALDDGSDLMLYSIRDADGTPAATSAGTLRRADGTRVHLARDDFSIEALDHWTSPHSRGRYPSRWRIAVPSAGIALEVAPERNDHELDTKGSTDVTYWEGPCRFRGTVGQKMVDAWGFVELVGYAKRFGTRL